MSDPSASTFYSGTLEIDHRRGVIYFHCNPSKGPDDIMTLLRICRLPTIPFGRSLDITHMVGCDWRAKGQS